MKRELHQHWLNISEAAKFLGVSKDTLRNWERQAKLIPRRTPGGHRRYSVKALEKYLNQPYTAPANKSLNQTKVAIQPKPTNYAKKATKTNNKSQSITILTIILATVAVILIGIILGFLATALTNYFSQPAFISPV